MPMSPHDVLVHSKDRSPEETVSHIRGILTRLGLHVYEVEWGEGLEGCHFVRIELEELPGVGTNGKGTSKALALASAYAEFIERLQNNYLVFPDQFGLMRELDTTVPDQALIPMATLRKKRHLWDHLVDPEKGQFTLDDSCEVPCLPYFNIATGDVEHLPFGLLAAVNGSSGMCAGNTPQEALVQGICEVLERHVITQIFSDNPPAIPTIPHSAIADLEACQLIEKLEARGSRVLVKDCTLGGQLPVLGVFACDLSRGEYRASFGSDPLAEIALQRCVTEMFQGHSQKDKLPLDFHTSQYTSGPTASRRKNRQLAQALFICSSEGILPNNLFLSQEIPSFESAFLHRFESNEASLKFLADRIRSIASDFFVRDVSFLGFPAFHLYAPELSQAFGKRSGADLEFMYQGESAKRCLLSIERATETEIRECADLFGRFWERHRHDIHIAPSLRHLNLITDGDSDIEEFKHTDYILTLLCLRLGLPDRAAEHLSEFLGANANEIDNLPYFTAALVYLRCKAAGKSTAQTGKILNNMLGEQLASEVIEDLAHPEAAFKYLDLPTCGDCESCKMEPHCLYEDWKLVKGRLLEELQANPIDQTQLAKLFRT